MVKKGRKGIRTPEETGLHTKGWVQGGIPAVGAGVDPRSGHGNRAPCGCRLRTGVEITKKYGINKLMME
ncbi:hypothetical protein [Thermoactinomyces mirandus]|uniref:hypothetical protein n=1 Tax=Thermoactinomyces mirandus TaxID=2756294 RepID=UPI00406CADE7